MPAELQCLRSRVWEPGNEARTLGLILTLHSSPSNIKHVFISSFLLLQETAQALKRELGINSESQLEQLGSGSSSIPTTSHR